MNIGDLASQIDYNSTEDCGDFFWNQSTK